MEPVAWKTCSSCKGDIGFDEVYYVCSVSTCNRAPTAFRFCSVECCDMHIPTMRHRDAGAVEERSPTLAEWRAREDERAEDPPPREERADSAGSEATLSETDLPIDVLVVVSKVKAWVRARSGMNTSDGVARVLSDHLRRVLDDGIRSASRADRKTVLDRDFRHLK